MTPPRPSCSRWSRKAVGESIRNVSSTFESRRAQNSPELTLTRGCQVGRGSFKCFVFHHQTFPGLCMSIFARGDAKGNPEPWLSLTLCRAHTCAQPILNTGKERWFFVWSFSPVDTILGACESFQTVFRISSFQRGAYWPLKANKHTKGYSGGGERTCDSVCYYYRLDTR